MLNALFPPGTLTVHIGQSNAPSTLLARAVLPQSQILEIGPAMSIDTWRNAHRVPHLNHVVVQDFAMLQSVMAGAKLTLAHARIDILHFRVPPDKDFSLPAARLRRDGYIPFLAERGKPQMLDGRTGFPPARLPAHPG